MSKTQANSEVGTDDLFHNRWSPRAFDVDKKVSKSDLDSCLEAARWAPSCFGDQPWRFVVCVREDQEQAWENLLSCLAPKNQQWAKYAPVLVMVCTNTVFDHNGNENRWAQYDAGAASISLCLQAASLGLATHQMGGFDACAVSEKLLIPEAFTPMAAIALGHQGDITQLDKDLQEIEATARKRKPLEEIMFFGTWPAIQ